MPPTTTEAATGSKINSTQLIKDLAVLSGIVKKSGDDSFDLQKDWFSDPIKNLKNMPSDVDRRQALVNIFSDVWGSRSEESPLQDAEGKADENKWFAIPKSLDDPEDTSGLYFVPEAESEEAVFGLGLMHETSFAGEKVSFKPFAFFPMLSLPFEDGNPLIFGKKITPYPLGLNCAFPEIQFPTIRWNTMASRSLPTLTFQSLPIQRLTFFWLRKRVALR